MNSDQEIMVKVLFVGSAGAGKVKKICFYI